MSEDKRTVWVVCDGEYSDYHLVGVYSSKENAELVAYVIGGDAFEVKLEEYIDKAKLGLAPFFASVDRNGHSVWPPHKESIDEGRDVERFRVCLSSDGIDQEPYIQLEVHCWAKHKRHALKITNEVRARLIASDRLRDGVEGRLSEA